MSVEFKRGMKALRRAQTAFQKQHWDAMLTQLSVARYSFHSTQAILLEAQVEELQGDAHELQNEKLKALECYMKAMKLRTQAGSSVLIAESALKLAHIENQLENYASAHDHTQYALDIFEKIQNPLKLTQTFLQHGEIYFAEHDYRTAIFFLQLGEEQLSKHFNPQLAANLYENLGMNFFRLKNYAEANRTWLRALAVAQQAKNYHRIVVIISYMLVTNAALGLNHAAESNLKDVQQLMHSLRSHMPVRTVGLILHNLSESLLLLGDFPRATQYCEQYIEWAETSGETHNTMHAVFLMGQIQACRTNYAAASATLYHPYLQEAMDYAHQLHDLEFNLEIQRFYIQLARKQKDLDWAEKILEKMTNLGKSDEVQSWLKAYFMGINHEYRGFFAYDTQEYGVALEYFEAAINFFKQGQNEEALAEAYYNAACCAARLHIPEKIVSYLQLAIQFFPRYKILAQFDADFEGLEQYDLFQKLIH